MNADYMRILIGQDDDAAKLVLVLRRRDIQVPRRTMARVNVETRYISPTEPSLPALAVQTTRLVDIYMIWVGATDVEPAEVHNAPLKGCLARDWACAMPARDQTAGFPPAATSLYRSSGSEAALSMAQRLTRRFKKQIFLSIDVPPTLQSMGNEGRLVLAVEKAVVDALEDIESRV